MNIFTVLSQGKGRLNEENLSAMLGYLLMPSETHGLGDTFLRPFLNCLAAACGDSKRFDDVLNAGKRLRCELFLENPYDVDGQRRVVDIELRMSLRAAESEAADIELHRIAIENKVKAQAADAEQLKEEFLGILQDLDNDDSVAVTMVFLTPPAESIRFQSEYDTLDAKTLGPHRKAWLRWAGKSDDRSNVVALLRLLLVAEADAQISPLAEYLRHTLKAFIRHIQESPAGTFGRLHETVNPGEIVQVIGAKLGNTVYQLERHESMAIRVLNLASREYEVAKPILRQINTELKLGVDLNARNGVAKNTRILGRDVINALLAQNKTYPLLEDQS